MDASSGIGPVQMRFPDFFQAQNRIPAGLSTSFARRFRRTFMPTQTALIPLEAPHFGA